MTVKLNPTALLAAAASGVGMVLYALASSFVGTVYATERVTADHTKDLAVIDVRFAGYDAMRPQVQELMLRMQSIERKLDEALESKTKKRGN